METVYKVINHDSNKEYVRDTVERGYYLYKNMLEDGTKNISLVEVSSSGNVTIRTTIPEPTFGKKEII